MSLEEEMQALETVLGDGPIKPFRVRFNTWRQRYLNKVRRDKYSPTTMLFALLTSGGGPDAMYDPRTRTCIVPKGDTTDMVFTRLHEFAHAYIDENEEFRNEYGKARLALNQQFSLCTIFSNALTGALRAMCRDVRDLKETEEGLVTRDVFEKDFIYQAIMEGGASYLAYKAMDERGLGSCPEFLSLKTPGVAEVVRSSYERALNTALNANELLYSSELQQGHQRIVFSTLDRTAETTGLVLFSAITPEKNLGASFQEVLSNPPQSIDEITRRIEEAYPSPLVKASVYGPDDEPCD